MGFWDSLKDHVNSMNRSLQTKVAKFKNAEFAAGSMAMCAIIAAADGNVDGAEKAKTAGLIANNEALKVFPVAELKEKFDFFCGKLTADYSFGRIECLQAIGKLKKTEDQARAVIQIGIIIGGADGNFDANEKKAVRDACFALGINPTEFDL